MLCSLPKSSRGRKTLQVDRVWVIVPCRFTGRQHKDFMSQAPEARYKLRQICNDAISYTTWGPGWRIESNLHRLIQRRNQTSLSPLKRKLAVHGIGCQFNQ